jgi:hypothetical protein
VGPSRSGRGARRRHEIPARTALLDLAGGIVSRRATGRDSRDWGRPQGDGPLDLRAALAPPADVLQPGDAIYVPPGAVSRRFAARSAAPPRRTARSRQGHDPPRFELAQAIACATS